MKPKRLYSRIFIVILPAFISIATLSKAQNSHSIRAYKTSKLAIEATSTAPVSFTKVSLAVAQTLYATYAQKVKSGQIRPHFCETITDDTLKYIRLVKNTVNGHLQIDDKNLPGYSSWKTQYAGVRLYPYLYNDATRTYNYILSYTVISSDTVHADISTSYYLLTIRRKFNWCELVAKRFRPDEKNSSHHICSPRCPDSRFTLSF